MSINIADTILSGAASGEVFKVKYSATDILKIDTSGRVLLPNQIGFTAGGINGAGDGWVIPTVGWNPCASYWGGTVVNFGNCFNVANGRFTAPVTGRYLFTASSYCYKPAAQADCMYTIFFVNSNSSLRRTTSIHRISGRSAPAGYSYDLQTEEVLTLVAGDYLELWMYNPSGSRIYPAHLHFAGALIG